MNRKVEQLVGLLNCVAQDLAEVLSDEYGTANVRIRIDAGNQANCYLGRSERLIRYYVAGTKQPTMETLIKMSNFFECSIDYIVGLTDNPKRC